LGLKSGKFGYGFALWLLGRDRRAQQSSYVFEKTETRAIEA